MKKAAYYARVSTHGQKERETIESQKAELVKQIKKDGNVLVKEYTDDGWSGARLDRPALDEMREDIKTDLFDVVYFLDADRIAREVSYQNILISELLKNEKDIIIKGRNYIDNPENKFNLTVMGAVNELEKAKILERFMRGRREKARRGAIVDNANPYGYDHILKTDKSEGRYELNDEQAEVVKYIFETYAHSDISLKGLCRELEKKNIKTATGKNYWAGATVRGMLTNTTYYGSHYFDKTQRVEGGKTVERYAKTKKTTTKAKDRSEWIHIPVPAIIPKELFDAVQKKLKRNKKRLRSASSKYLLGGMIKCGICDHTYSGTRWDGIEYYRCNHRDKMTSHINKDQLMKCHNKAIKAEEVEDIVLNGIKEKLTKPQVIKKYIDLFSANKDASRQMIQRKMKRLEKQIEQSNHKKERVLDLYADGKLEKDVYINKIESIDEKSNKWVTEKTELELKLSLMKKRKDIQKDVTQFCKKIRRSLENLSENNKKKVFRSIIEQMVIYKNDDKKKLLIKGFIPVLQGENTSLPNHCKSNWCSTRRWRQISSPRRNIYGTSRRPLSR